MFRAAEIRDWWPYSQKYEELRFLRDGELPKCVLKSVGYAHMLRLIEERAPKRILEIGHGPSSPVFNILKSQDVELWGVDKFSGTLATTPEQYELFRQKYPKAKFMAGLFGNDALELPGNYFDFVFSVSTVEHVPVGAIPKFCSELQRVLNVGGLSTHSVDVYLGAGGVQFKHQNIRQVFAGHDQDGFKWLEPTAGFDIQIDPANILMEDGRSVMETYMSHQPMETRRWPGNFITILVGAEKCHAQG